jgi:hypothetical protein
MVFVFANTAEENPIVKSVVGLLFANTGEKNQNVKSVAGLIFVNMVK